VFKLTVVAIMMLAWSVAPMAPGPHEDALDAAQRGDYANALRIWSALAERGDASAQNNVGNMFARGAGVPQDFAEAVKWWGKAADRG
jgi:TPR repeat protein